jgi:putative ABC transport system permease protein
MIRFIRRLGWLFRFRARSAELQEELAFHREQHERDAIARGLSPADARDAARRAMGNETYQREEARGVWLWPRLETICSDIVYALRGFRRNPMFTIGITLTLAIGIGANASMFSMVDRLLLRPPAFISDPGSVHRLYVYRTSRGVERSRALPYALYADIARGATEFPLVAGITRQGLGVTRGGVTRPMLVAAVSAPFFRFFDAAPLMGRFFTDAEDRLPAGTPVVVLSASAWRNEFGSSLDVVGRTMRIGDLAYEIIGVAPDGFGDVWPYRPPQAFIPLTTYGAQESGPGWETNYGHAFGLEMIARRPEGMTAEAASAFLTDVYRRRYQEQFARDPQGPTISEARPRIQASSILPARGGSPSSVARISTWITGVTLIILLIACANVASLLLSRMVRRRREVAVRVALGAGRGRLFSQLFTEGMLIAAIGGFVGIVTAVWGSAVLQAAFLPGTERVPLLTDGRTLLVVTGMVLAIGLVTGLIQIQQAGRASLTDDLKSGSRDGAGGRIRLRGVLLTVQCTLSVILLVGAGLFVRSLNHVRGVRLGFDPNPVLLVELDDVGRTKLDSAMKIALRQRLLAAAQSVPGVSSVSLQNAVPFGGMSQWPIAVAGVDSARALGDFNFNTVSEGYFLTMGTRILRGRGIEERDVEGAEHVLVVSESMGKVLWPGKDPIGQCVRIGIPAETAPCRTVVGIAEDIHSSSFEPNPRLFDYYMPAAQWKPQDGGLLVSAQSGAATLLEPLRKRLQQEMPGTSYVTVTRLSDILDTRMRSWTLGARMFSAFGGLALLLSAIGLYSAIAYNVAQRRRELGVRLALGAEEGRVVRLMVFEGLRFAIPGLMLGCGLALFAGRWVKPLLFSQSPYDPVVFGLVVAVLLVVATVASWVPARRAGRLDPKVALQAE